MAPRLVLDTNVTLDGWWFADPRAARLVSAIEGGQLHWLASDAMRDELVDVLQRPQFGVRPQACAAALQAFDRWSCRWPAPAASGPLRSADADDQMFIDLALAAGATWLVSRDRALLDLGPRAMSWNCRIVTPDAWARAASI